MELREYDPAWPELFEEEGLGVLESLDMPVQAIEHIGSTAVPRLPARPVIDIAIGVGDLEFGSKFVVPLQGAGYQYLGQDTRPGQLDFHKRGQRAVDLFVVEFDGALWQRHLGIRDTLRSDEQERGQLADIKRSVAAEEGVESEAYEEAKAQAFDAITTD